MKTTILLFFGFIVILIIGGICAGIYNDTNVSVVEKCKVINLQQQQLIKGSGKSVSTEIRYLVITDKETFICESSIVNGKYDNSNVFFHLKENNTYNFKVCGLGKSILFDYRNILDVVE